MARMRLALILLTVLWLAACGDSRRLVVELDWDSALPLAGDVVLTVRLHDVARLDGSAGTLDGQRIPLAGREPPLRVELRQPRRPEAGSQLVVFARIDDAEQLLLISPESPPVAGRRQLRLVLEAL